MGENQGFSVLDTKCLVYISERKRQVSVCVYESPEIPWYLRPCDRVPSSR